MENVENITRNNILANNMNTNYFGKGIVNIKKNISFLTEQIRELLKNKPEEARKSKEDQNCEYCMEILERFQITSSINKNKQLIEKEITKEIQVKI